MKNKFQIITNINLLNERQKREMGLVIGEFLANVLLEKRRNNKQFDFRYVQNNLKQT